MTAALASRACSSPGESWQLKLQLSDKMYSDTTQGSRLQPFISPRKRGDLQRGSVSS
jgi:hypothetical protein